MNRLLLALISLSFLAYQSGPVTPTELRSCPYTLLVDTTGLYELSLPQQQLILRATAGRRTYRFGLDGKGLIKSEGGMFDGDYPFVWTLRSDSLFVLLQKNQGYALSRQGKDIILTKRHYKAWLKPVRQ